jgi:RNA polymerase sigma factor (sigma-70 family)
MMSEIEMEVESPVRSSEHDSFHFEHFLFRIAQNIKSEDAEDARQNAALIIWRLQKNGRLIESYDYIAKIFWNEKRSISRKKYRERKFLSFLDHKTLEYLILARGSYINSDPANSASIRELLKNGLESLRPRDREVLTLFIGTGLSHKEIADTLRITEHAVTQSLYRSRQTFRALVEGKEEDLYDQLS